MTKKIYFPNLNGLRFIAAFGVIIHHVEQFKYLFKEPNNWDIPFFDVIGKVSVILFFVLSGFLITYLLLDEQAANGRIAIKAFYMRRVRRIWPVYYLMVFLGMFVFPRSEVFFMPELSASLHDGFIRRLILLLLILPNLVTVPVPVIYQTWSIGVEEQFYLFWPILFRKIKDPLKMCLYVITGYLVVQFIVLPIVGSRYLQPHWFRMATETWGRFSIDCMAIGGVTAIILFRRYEKILGFLFSKPVEYGTYLLVILMIANGVVLPYLNFEIYAILFASLILNLAANPNAIVNFEFRALNYLGKISYGIYMYHLIGISVAHYIANRFLPGNNFILYGVSTGLTILISVVSYELFEHRIIKLGKRPAAAREQASLPDLSARH